ncbi:hypothetical protein JOC36_000038 [Weissella uvarum]|uniref:hypothetical protein n=1 Tax=Weissella uvarum TaxID=1479233 RepID=UPI0019613C6B|nr:hypothetical protein [Weissella uvarum]MBM7616505.1 hypothetical protein [Weissella uvarum]MCM0595034.1 hypothetical protein [Weissella uvarum]
MTEKQENSNLIASTLTNPMGTTVIGHVNGDDLTIRLTQADGQLVSLPVDAGGDFVYRYDEPISDATLTVEALRNGEVVDRVDAEIEMPAPVVTGVVSTRDDQRYLEGRVNQPDTSVAVQVMGEQIDVVVDDNREFEMLLPQEVNVEEIVLTCVNEKTHKRGHSKVSLGVTSKTQAMPILTDEMIHDYQEQQAPQAKPEATVQSDQTTAPVAESEHDFSVPDHQNEYQFESLTDDDVVSQNPADNVQLADGSDTATTSADETKAASRSQQTKKSGFFAKLFGKLF